MHLLVAPFLAGVVLVEAGEIAVIAFVQPDILGDGNARLAGGSQHEIDCALRAYQIRGKGGIERNALSLQLLASLLGFLHALLGEVDITPSGEQVFQIPLALAVTHQHQHAIAHHSFLLFPGFFRNL